MKKSVEEMYKIATELIRKESRYDMTVNDIEGLEKLDETKDPINWAYKAYKLGLYRGYTLKK